MSSPPPEKPSPGPPGKRPPKRPEGDEAPRPGFSSGWLILIVIFGLLLIYMYQTNPQNVGRKVPYSFFLDQLEKKNVAEVTFHGEIVTGKWKELPPDPENSNETLSDSEFNTVVTPGAVADSRLETKIREISP